MSRTTSPAWRGVDEQPRVAVGGVAGPGRAGVPHAERVAEDVVALGQVLLVSAHAARPSSSTQTSATSPSAACRLSASTGGRGLALCRLTHTIGRARPVDPISCSA